MHNDYLCDLSSSPISSRDCDCVCVLHSVMDRFGARFLLEVCSYIACRGDCVVGSAVCVCSVHQRIIQVEYISRVASVTL